MRSFLYILILLAVPAFLLAQAEYQQVRQMFAKPNAYIPVQVWKGLMFASHPVEFFIGERDKQVHGYYRIISSGEKFLLEGEVVDDDYVMTEYNLDNEDVGSFVLHKFRETEDNAVRSASWYNKAQSDVMPLNLQLGSYSDHPPAASKSFVRKFAGVNSIEKIGKYECYFIEFVNEHEILVHYGSSDNNWTQRAEAVQTNPLKFELEIDGEQAIFNEINDKLRRRYREEFAYFSLENKAEFKKIAYANDHFICDVDFPVLKSLEFNEWIESLVEKRKQEARNTIAAEVENADMSSAEIHFKYKWLGWTEIDLLTDQLVSGRIVFNKSWNNEQELIPFTFNLTEGKAINIYDQFKQDFDLKDYLTKLAQSNINKWKLEGTSMNPSLEASQFDNLTVSDYHLIVSTDFDRVYGYHQIKIPFNELKGLVRRNSIFKNLMR